MEYFLTRKMQYRGIKLRSFSEDLCFENWQTLSFFPTSYALLEFSNERYFIFQLELFTLLTKGNFSRSQIIDIVFTITFKFVVHYLFNLIFLIFFASKIYLKIINIKKKNSILQFSKFFQLISTYCSIVSSIEKLKISKIDPIV